ncbi:MULTISPECIES: D-arabinono-1,4-lactone oxidase [Rhizobium/Agrobacterium group]|uniref:D-arabinono-1,4-lactone oxidase n=1 Tax=Rhizobium/Agrobacterium group TaxID=227290 RepID=UPI0008FAE944|nr:MULTISPECIES: D-arabinono-1,4-lactone oxidase [Rhizobium/Agrobacterium group]MCF1464402.1 FAD-binding protein [Allorhizobium ampelinum]MCF1495343.1 FAD-binding protein [Allorhizobium ampelinum]MUZ54208.1 FAD-binding protein [Agrobacterium vitis]MUZ93891.1 FAD-binding protein [Agrobacterium vitis]MVA41967.1 FAD-binding protein [Agrobacterium vitis]
MSIGENSILEPGKLWWNWFGEQNFVPRHLAQPRTEEEVRQAVLKARALNLPVRASGRGHSNPPIVATPGVQIDLSQFAGVTAVDLEKYQVTVEPGITVGDLSRYLRTKGMSLNNQGDIDTQSICGALATGTHGAGITLPCLSAQMVAARIVTADGSFLDTTAEKDGDLFRAFRTSLGMFGIVVSITLQAVPSYNIHKRSWNTDVEDCIEGLQQRLKDNRTFWFFWLPHQTSAELFVLPDGIPSTASRAADICHMRTYNAVPVSEPGPELGPGEEFDHSSVIFPNLYEPNFREMEYAVPFADYEETFAEVRHLFLTKYPDETYPVESRPVKADDSYLSAYAERDGYAIGVSGKPEASTWPLLRDVDAIFERRGGRPHWGKHHFMTPARLEKLYPRYDAFKTMRREIDPDGIFLNDHLRGLFA